MLLFVNIEGVEVSFKGERSKKLFCSLNKVSVEIGQQKRPIWEMGLFVLFRGFFRKEGRPEMEAHLQMTVLMGYFLFWQQPFWPDEP